MKFMHPLGDSAATDVNLIVGKIGSELTSKTCQLEFSTAGALQIMNTDDSATHWQPTVTGISDAPYYLVLGNEGSLIQYNSKKEVVYEVFPASLGLNNMVYMHYQHFHHREDAYSQAIYGATISDSYLIPAETNKKPLSLDPTIAKTQILSAGGHYITLHKSTVWAITTTRAIFDIRKTVFIKSHYKDDYMTIPIDDDDARYLTYSMKDEVSDNDHTISIV